MNLAQFKEQISDDFQSTFSIVDENTLMNMIGFEGDFKRLVEIIQKYMPGAKVWFHKTNQFDGEYDIYCVRSE